MKKVLSLLVAVILAVSALSVFSGAVSETDFNDLQFTLVSQTGSGINFIDDDVLLEGKYCMRGFAASPDGKYLFGGTLNPSNASAIIRFDTETGHAGAYWYYEQTEGESVGTRSYPKGLAADDRGYLYVGLAYNPNKIRAYLAVVKTDEVKDDLMKTVSVVPVYVDENNTKVGVNGVAVKCVNGKYYAYVIVNYNEDYLYRFDVTSPESPVLDTTFGNGGRVDLQKITTTTSGAITEGNYIDVDDDGSIYMGFTAASGAGLIKLSEDGNTVLAEVAQATGYAVALVEDYVLCASQKNGSEVVVYDKISLEKKTSFTITTTNTVLPYPESYNLAFLNPVNSIVGMRYVNGVLYLCDQTSSNAGFDQIFAVGITAEGKANLKAYTDLLEANAKALVETTAAPETTVAPAVETTEAPAVETTAAPAEETTEAPAVETTAASAAETTAAPAPAKKGCGSFASIALLPAALVLSAVVIRRKKD